MYQTGEKIGVKRPTGAGDSTTKQGRSSAGPTVNINIDGLRVATIGV